MWHLVFLRHIQPMYNHHVPDKGGSSSCLPLSPRIARISMKCGKYRKTVATLHTSIGASGIYLRIFTDTYAVHLHKRRADAVSVARIVSTLGSLRAQQSETAQRTIICRKRHPSGQRNYGCLPSPLDRIFTHRAAPSCANFTKPSRASPSPTCMYC